MSVNLCVSSSDQLHLNMNYEVEYREDSQTKQDDILENLLIIKRLIYGLGDRLDRLEQTLGIQQGVRPMSPPPRLSDDDLNDRQPPPKKPVKSRLGVKGRLGPQN